MSAQPFTLYEAPTALLALRLRQAELRRRAATMKAYAARLEQDAEAIELELNDEPGCGPDLDLKHALRALAKHAGECERLRRELGK